MCVRKAKTRRAFCDIGNCFAPYKAKAYGEAHSGGMELWRKCDPPADGESRLRDSLLFYLT